MNLDGSNRALLRNAMLGAFDADKLNLFLQDKLDVVLTTVVAEASFEMQCQQFIIWAEHEGRLVEFLKAIEANHGNAGLKVVASQLLTAAVAVAAAATGGPPRPYLVSQRPVLDRSTFWAKLGALKNGGVGSRVLAVSGGVGKSYSRWPVSHICDPTKNVTRMVRVEVNEGKVVRVDGARLANLISLRLWGDGTLADPDDLALASRVTRISATQLIQRFAALQEPTWLILDEFNLVNLDDSAIDMLGKLAEAIDGGECPKLWLFLFGLDPGTLGPRVGKFVAVDQVQRPSRNDIEDYLLWFADWVARPSTATSVSGIVNALDALLPTSPKHSDWEAFHALLDQKCTGIAKGTLP